MSVSLYSKGISIILYVHVADGWEVLNMHPENIIQMEDSYIIA